MESRATDKNSYTIQFMVYDNYREIVGSNPSGTQCVLSKRSTFSTSTSSSAPAGWNIYFVSSGGNSLLRFNSGQATGNVSTAYGVVRKDAPWSVFTYVFEEKGDAQYSDTLKLYINGELDQKVRINWNGKLSNDAPLTIGKISGSNTGAATRFFVTNVQFYNIALPPEFIKSNFGKTRIDEIENFEYWDNLLGYWPNDREEDYGGNVLKDYSKYGSVYGGINSGRSDMDIVGNLFWASGNSIEENIHPAPGDSYYKSVFNTVDLPYQVFMWLGEDIDSSWKLEGIGRSLNYTSVQQ
jgi:hypothetical protein